MKYIITRSSAWGEKPIESATPAQVHLYSYRYTSISDVWVAEVDDLHEFVRIYGEIILKEPDNEEGLWTIEIYDDYRE